MRIDVWSGMRINVVMFFYHRSVSDDFVPHGITGIASAAQAAEGATAFAGNITYWLFAIGIVARGYWRPRFWPGLRCCAIWGVSAGERGLNRPLGQAYAFYGIIILSMLAGLAIKTIGLDPRKALIYAAVASGVVAPVILLLCGHTQRQQENHGQWVQPQARHMDWLLKFIVAAMSGCRHWCTFSLV